jgi:hypothetical protein
MGISMDLEKHAQTGALVGSLVNPMAVRSGDGCIWLNPNEFPGRAIFSGSLPESRRRE